MIQENSPQKENFITKIREIVLVRNKTNEQLEKLLEKMKSRRWLVILGCVVTLTFTVTDKLGGFLVVLYITYYVTIQHVLRIRRFLKTYASSRNLNFGNNLDEKTLTGRILKRIDGRFDGSFVFNNHSNFLNKIFYFSYDGGSGKHPEIYNFTLTEITIDQAVIPYILLQKNSAKKHQSFDSFGDDKDVQVSLGAYDNEYTLYTTNHYEVEALQICAPEFVDLIKNSYLPLNVEFAENHLYIYTQTHLSTEKDLDELCRVTYAVIDTFGNFLLRMKDDYQALHDVYRKEK